MAMPQRDNFIEQIHRLEGLIAVAEQQKDWAELGRADGSEVINAVNRHQPHLGRRRRERRSDAARRNARRRNVN